MLQSPTDPIPDVIYDQAMFANIGPPTLDQVQWSDFPGAKTLSFSGRTWRVKGPGYYGPGPNLFSDAASNARPGAFTCICAETAPWYSLRSTVKATSHGRRGIG